MNILDRLRQGVTTGSAEETRSVATELAGVLPADTTIALHGDLGVGKTTFVQGLARGLGIMAPVTSPTYTIYTILNSPVTGQTANRQTAAAPRRMLVHLDAYRLNSPAEFDALLLDDFLKSPWCLAIEWPEKVGDRLPENALHIVLGIGPDKRHSIQLG